MCTLSRLLVAVAKQPHSALPGVTEICCVSNYRRPNHRVRSKRGSLDGDRLDGDRSRAALVERSAHGSPVAPDRRRAGRAGGTSRGAAGASTCCRVGRARHPGRGIHHAALICSDVEQTIQFYQGLLGFPLVELVENRDYKGSSHFFFDLGNQTLLGFFDFPGLGLEPGIEAIGGVQHIAISVPARPLGAAPRRLDAEGVKYAGPDLGIEESMYFKDPDGIQIELLSDPLMYFARQPARRVGPGRPSHE